MKAIQILYQLFGKVSWKYRGAGLLDGKLSYFSYTEDGKMRASFLDIGSGNSKDIDLSIKENVNKNDSEIDIDQFKVE